MAQNIEVKCRVSRLEPIRTLLQQRGIERRAVLVQRDTFFISRQGRIKLRQIRDGQAQLIIYLRSDEADIRLSEYMVVEVTEAAKLETLLSQTLGSRGVVQKTRELYLIENIRIHLDVVEHLGEFVEFEAVLGEPDQTALNQEKVHKLMEQLGIRDGQICGEAYIDLLENGFA